MNRLLVFALIVAVAYAPATSNAATTTRYPPNVNCGCEQVSNTGFITSPKFPYDYPNEADCAYFIQLAPNTTGAVKLKFLTFVLESSKNCKADSVKVYDGENGYAPVIAKLCGKEPIKPIITSGKAVFLRFVTDVAIVERGFNISWERASCEEAGGLCAKTCQYGEWEEQQGTCKSSTLKCCKPKPPPTTPHPSTTIPTTPAPTTTPTTSPTTTRPPTTTTPTNPPPICGKRFITGDDSPYIVGGKEARPNSWPWMLSIYKDNRYACGAVLLSDQWAVTKAGCVYKSLVVTAVAGQHDLLMLSGDEVYVDTYKIIVHEGFVNRSPWPNDIALLRLSKKLKLGPKIFPACFPQTEDMEFSPRDNCYATGWGETKGTGDRTVLNELAIHPIPNSVCRPYFNQILDTNICVGDGRTSACKGDGGSPLVCKKGDKWFVAGVSSFLKVSCTGAPSVYTRLSKYKAWVDVNIEDNGGY